MVFFNYALRKLNAKIVYYGPGLCGKTTNLQWIHDHFEGGQKGKMISLATEGDRTIFFDLLPIEIGTIRGMEVTLQLYTVPGQVHYNSTRQLVLRGADGVVFVADSQKTMRKSNQESFKNLAENLLLQGIDLKDFPHVLQFNKRDLRDLLSIEELDADLNDHACPFFEATAPSGIGVQETLEGIVKLVMRKLRDRYESTPAGGVRPTAAAPAPRRPAPAPAAPRPAAPAPTAPPPPRPVAPLPPVMAAAGPEDIGIAALDEPESASFNQDSDRGRIFADSPAAPPASAAAEPFSSSASKDDFDQDNVTTASFGEPEQSFDDGFATSSFAADKPEILSDAGFAGDAPGGPEARDSSAGDELDSADADASRFADTAPISSAALDALDDDTNEVEVAADDFAAASSLADATSGPIEALENPFADATTDTGILFPPPDEAVEEVADPFGEELESPVAAAAEAAPDEREATFPPVFELDESPARSEAKEADTKTILVAPTRPAAPPAFPGVGDEPFASPPTPAPQSAPAAARDELTGGFTTRSAHSADDLVAQALGVKARAKSPAPPQAAPAPGLASPPAAVAAPPPPSPPPPPAPTPVFQGTGVFMLDDEDPFAMNEAPQAAAPPPVAASSAAAVVVAQPPREQPAASLGVSADSNRLALRLHGTGAIAQAGQVRELDIEVPVPGSWVGNQRVTLQLRLTLVPAPEDSPEDMHDGQAGPA